MSEKILNMSGDFDFEFNAYQAPANTSEILSTTLECNTFGTCTNIGCSTLGC
ncbi:hypothetical protein [Pseudomonas brassicacearum]|jgi:hypothetical protein|uniref:hypothetical protein n=1 Tax=Pseudomonas brassicacearum TaxID=930166 RepID=UPI0015E7336B|nr:hypothetical protein [Pseudomonas brassicacearum]